MEWVRPRSEPSTTRLRPPPQALLRPSWLSSIAFTSPFVVVIATSSGPRLQLARRIFHRLPPVRSNCYQLILLQSARKPVGTLGPLREGRLADDIDGAQLRSLRSVSPVPGAGARRRCPEAGRMSLALDPADRNPGGLLARESPSPAQPSSSLRRERTDRPVRAGSAGSGWEPPSLQTWDSKEVSRWAWVRRWR
jgi:hypothetical protein